MSRWTELVAFNSDFNPPSWPYEEVTIQGMEIWNKYCQFLEKMKCRYIFLKMTKIPFLFPGIANVYFFPERERIYGSVGTLRFLWTETLSLWRSPSLLYRSSIPFTSWSLYCLLWSFLNSPWIFLFPNPSLKSIYTGLSAPGEFEKIVLLWNIIKSILWIVQLRK